MFLFYSIILFIDPWLSFFEMLGLNGLRSFKSFILFILSWLLLYFIIIFFDIFKLLDVLNLINYSWHGQEIVIIFLPLLFVFRIYHQISYPFFIYLHQIILELLTTQLLLVYWVLMLTSHWGSVYSIYSNDFLFWFFVLNHIGNIWSISYFNIQFRSLTFNISPHVSRKVTWNSRFTNIYHQFFKYIKPIPSRCIRISVYWIIRMKYWLNLLMKTHTIFL